MSLIAQHEALRHRRYLIAGLGLCILALFVSGRLLSREFATALGSAPGTVGLAAATLLVYAFAILRRPGSKTDNLQARSLGLKWGVAAGCLWTLCVIEGSFWLLAAILPLFPGALGAIGCGKVRGGTLAGFWCGVAGGLIGFVAIVTASNVAFLLAKVGADNEIVGGGIFVILMLYGLIYCPVVGTLAGLIGILLERTGRPAGAWKAHAALGMLAIVGLLLLGAFFAKNQ